MDFADRGRRSPTPDRLHLVVLKSLQRPRHGFVVGEQLNIEKLLCAFVRHNHLVVETLDNRPGDAAVDRRHEPDPQRGKSRRQNRNVDQVPAESARLRVPVKHVAIRQHVFASDLEDPTAAFRYFERLRQVVQHIADGNRLRRGGHPARCDQHRKAFSEIADELEGKAAGSDDHRRTEFRDRYRA